ncbi:MAG TPA: biotin--[acetyl-CoA-carboxylase] ligase [Fimbriiglobus sp.]
MNPTPRETWRPDTRHIGRPVYWFDELDSTNAYAQTLSAGAAVIADHQTAGRGQYGRTWTSRPGASLLISFVLDPPAEWRRAVVLTAWAAVAVGETIRRLTNQQARIKWPNDLLVRGKKICGILIEQGRSLVCGIGLNVNQSAEEFAAAGLPEATSLAIVGETAFDLRAVATAAIHSLDEGYDRLVSGEIPLLESEWKWRTGLLGRSVVAELADGTTTAGRLRDMSFDGIELDAGDGAVRALIPEHVRQLRPG